MTKHVIRRSPNFEDTDGECSKTGIAQMDENWEVGQDQNHRWKGEPQNRTLVALTDGLNVATAWLMKLALLITVAIFPGQREQHFSLVLSMRLGRSRKQA